MGNVLPAGAQRVKVAGVADAVQEPVTGPLLAAVDQSKVMGTTILAKIGRGRAQLYGWHGFPDYRHQETEVCAAGIPLRNAIVGG